jgi:hypothetical protein
MINPQKSKLPPHNKLLTRFNNFSSSRISNQQHQQNSISQKLLDKNITLNKNNIILLKTHIQ